ncbi:hypothetical protein PENTCL1PPCAC_16091, partial [Pristionchus entomophagus]
MSPFSFFDSINRAKLEKFLDLPMPIIIGQLRACHLLRSHLTCPKCQVPCVEYSKLRPAFPGCGWRCNKCAITYSALRDSWFSRVRLDVRMILRLLYSFCWEQASLRSVKNELRAPDGSTISNQSFVDYLGFFREVCWLDNERQQKIGGPGKVVEIDETAFSKRKYNRGKRMAAQQWVFGGVERGNKTKLFAIPVAKRDAATLLSLIKYHIADGTEIHSDCWAAYNKISTLGRSYTHLTVNHSLTFKCKKTGACTNAVEGMWQKLKLPHKVRYGTHRSQLSSHVACAVFFIRHEKEHRFRAILESI